MSTTGRADRSAIAVKKIEDVVSARLSAGTERGPRHRRHRRKGGAERPITAKLGQLLEVWQFPFFEKAFGELRILTVEADNDEALDERAWMVATAERPQSQPHRPEHERQRRHHQSREQDKKRVEQRKAGAGTDIGLCGPG